MSEDATLVLVVENDANIVDLVQANLLARGFAVIVSRTGADSVELVDTRSPDVVLLDLMLPAVDGFDLCREIRERSSVGIIVVSARRGEQDKVRALNLGADDYLTKPFGIDELLARINALLRRSRPPAPPEVHAPVSFGSVTVDLEAQLVTKDGVAVHLTPTEFALLRELVLAPGKLLSHATLLRKVWGPGYETATEYTRVYVRRLRAKLEDPDGPALIATEPRAGYRMALPEERPNESMPSR
ncbi:MAG TPA: response regulator transcription factor [Acidimicrobiales bacterium]|jgi:two-component system KDP operon response regulator KdpE|nr:response regulator transcription factor [Acidimicrobiales bacterium]